MKVAVAVALAGLALALVDLPAQAADPDQPKLQGKWIVESFEYNGAPIEMLKDAVREFSDDKYTLKPKSSEGISGVIKLDSSTKPKNIDLEVNDRTLKGIYEIDGDTLKMSYRLNGDERPTEFVSKPDSGVVLVIHKRAK